jgi:4-aminobutyrate aminotransferase-like enzyme
MRIVKEMLKRAYIILPEGARGNVLSFTPPLTITNAQLSSAVKALHATL